MGQPVVFISYSRQDEQEKEKLLSHLAVLKGAGLIDLWSEDRIGAGRDWQQEIRAAMAQAQVAILLITANFLTSEFILGKAVPTLLKRHEREGLTVFPVIAKACAWRTVDWLANMHVRPRNERPVWSDAGSHVDEDLAAIVEEVAAIVKNAGQAASSMGTHGEAKSGPAKFAETKKRKPEPVAHLFAQSPLRQILVVEDEPSWQRRLTRILNEINCAVVIASNYEEAEARLANLRFDLVTIDLNLDKSTQYADGLELILQIRRTLGPQFPIIVITGTGSMEEQRRAFKDYNVFDFIQKAKLDLEEFQTIVLEAMRRLPSS